MLTSKGNVTEVLDWWKKLTNETRDLVELVGFREMVESMSLT